MSTISHLQENWLNSQVVLSRGPHLKYGCFKICMLFDQMSSGECHYVHSFLHVTSPQHPNAFHTSFSFRNVYCGALSHIFFMRSTDCLRFSDVTHILIKSEPQTPFITMPRSYHSKLVKSSRSPSLLLLSIGSSRISIPGPIL